MFCCNPVVRNGNKETTDALIRAMRDEALKRGLVRDELIDFCQDVMEKKDKAQPNRKKSTLIEE